jgi:photosystem II stability/assembly factor-like uncharacterized protein
VDLNGNVSLVKAGLTSVVDVAVDPRDGNLVFLQFARWEFPFVPNTGGVFKLKNGAIDTIAVGLNFPTGLRFNKDGEFFVSAFADGQILKITPSLAEGHWQLQSTLPGRPALGAVKAVSENVAWVAGFDDFVYRTTNGGQNWIQMGRVTTGDEPQCIEAIDSTTAFVGSGDVDLAFGGAKIYRTTDGGRHWNVVYTATGQRSFWDAIHFFDAQNGIAVSDPPEPGSPYLIVKTADGGATWTPIANPPVPNANEAGWFSCLYFYDNQNGWFGSARLAFTQGAAGRVFRTTDGGNTWTGFASGNTNDVTAVRFVSPMVGIRTSYAPPFLTRSTDGGQTWTTVSNLPISNIKTMFTATGVNTASGNQLWVSGIAGSPSKPFILASTDNGATWEQQPMADIFPGTALFNMSAASFGASSDSVRAWAVTLDFPSFVSAGQILTYVSRIGFVTSVEEQSSLPIAYSLGQNYPNPFNPETRIRYQLAKPDRVALKIYNMLGQEVRTLVNEFKSAGSFDVLWDGKDNSGQRMPNGVYLYRIETDGLVQSKKMLLLQ